MISSLTKYYRTFQEQQAHVSVLCEYDALPEIGHACGHNLIAECGVAAGIGIKVAMDQAGRKVTEGIVTESRIFSDWKTGHKIKAAFWLI